MPTVTASAAGPGATRTPYGMEAVAYGPTYESRAASTGARGGTRRGSGSGRGPVSSAASARTADADEGVPWHPAGGVQTCGRLVEEQRPGAVGASYREVEAAPPASGQRGRPATEGYARFARVVHPAPVLRSRPAGIAWDVLTCLEQAPREETGADADDPPPGLIAGQVDRVHRTVTAVVGREMTAGHNPDEVSREVLALLDGTADLLGERALNYAVRDAG